MFNHPFRPGIKISPKFLFALFLVALTGLLLVQRSIKQTPHPAREAMMAAAGKVENCHKALLDLRDSLSISVDAQRDPLRSGLIGEEFTPITTTLGDLKAKQLSTSPDFAALFIYWFDELGLQPGQRVVIHASASFPALILSAICAAETWRLKPVILSSAGASSFGANHRMLTWWDMESYLFKKRLIHSRTTFATPGGQDDNGASFWEEGMAICESAADRNNLQLFNPENLAHAIQAKNNYIKTFGTPAVFINIGGNQAALGDARCGLSIPPGLITGPLKTPECSSLIYQFNQFNIPVIHLLQIRELAAQYGLGGDALSFGGPGISKIYYRQDHSQALCLIALFIIFVSWAGFHFIRRYRQARSQGIAEQS